MGLCNSCSTGDSKEVTIERRTDSKLETASTRLSTQTNPESYSHLPTEAVPTTHISINNTIVLSILKQLGDYTFPDEKEPHDWSKYQAYEIDDVVYVGEFSQGRRHGKGKQIWKDGTVYEGMWEDDQANGKGRIIHSHGDVYLIKYGS